MKDDAPVGVVVHGHATSLTARYDDIELEAGLVLAFAAEVGDASADLHRLLLDPDLLASAVLDPVGSAKAGAALLAALDGPRGLTLLALDLARRGAVLSTVVELYRAADDTVAAALRGPVNGLHALDDLTDGAASRLLADLFGIDGETLVDLARIVDEAPATQPRLVERAAAAVSAAVAYSLRDATAVLSFLLADGSGRACSIGDPVAQPPIDRTRPVSGLIDRLRARSDDSQHRVHHRKEHPVIDVSAVVVRNPDGSTARRWVVNVPGTSAWDLGTVNSTNLRGNYNAMAGNNAAYLQAVEDTLRRRVPRGEPIMLVGHSLGGRIAMQAASGLTSDGHNVTHVLTAGAHVSDVHPPAHVHVLSLANRADPVPYIDGRPDPTGPRRTTVLFTDYERSPFDAHSLSRSYAGAAGYIDAGNDPAVVAWRESAAGFFDPGAHVQTDVQQVLRGPAGRVPECPKRAG